MEKSLIALSGGVDSSVAAFLLKKGGGNPTALYMRHSYQPTLTEEESVAFWSESPENGRIPLWTPTPDGRWTESVWRPDLFPLPAEAADAVRIAQFLEIPILFFDAEPIFGEVTENFTSEYLAGRTPNPCSLCNRILKFGKLIELAVSLGNVRFSTGHYVWTETQKEWRNRPENASSPLPAWLAERPDDETVLLRGGGLDLKKDQSYVLYGIGRENLPRLFFPLGRYSKEEVRQIAAEIRLPAAEKEESQDLCFVPDGSIPEFIRNEVGPLETAGNFVSTDGEVIGRHGGYERFTVGQRKGLGVGFGERIFVQRLDAARREVVLGSREELARTEIAAFDARWLLGVPIGEPFRAKVKIRYRSPAVWATLHVSQEGQLRAVLDEPRYGVAPGQSLVCYWGDRLLGGGMIQP